jgi:hypothetical protein
MTHIIAKEELPYGTIAHKFEGYRYGDVDVSFFLLSVLETGRSGRSPSLRSHYWA